ncbi:hypothetical protein MNBD_GAMMA05-887 [hydrothermal vent metagenome]|uniref:Calx-beta domain-containing protein n=1 Tax=hydrothermal vent metagenome TaxID=652676 RepID=A0A3B0X3I6_9ZZZZ
MFFVNIKYWLNKWQYTGVVLSLVVAPLLVNAAEIGSNDFLITDEAFENIDSDVSYNSIDNQYLVIRVGTFDDGVLPSDKYEIYGQFIDAATGAKTGNVFRISFTGMDVVAEANVTSADITYNITNNEFFIVWSASQTMSGEFEIYGLRINASTGVAIGDSVRLSDMGPDGDFTYAAFLPSVAYNSQNNEYFVVWMGDDDTAPLVNNEAEIFGQRVNANTGEEIGVDVRYSDMGPDGDTNYGANTPDVSYNDNRNEYLIVWQGDDNDGDAVDDEFEIFGQHVNAETGGEISGDKRLSFIGIDGQTQYEARNPAVAYSSIEDEYFVVYSGDDATGFLTGEYEIYGNAVRTALSKIKVGVRLSDMGDNGLSGFDARNPSISYNINNNEYLVVWQGDDNTGALVNDEFEIYSQRINASDGSEIGLDTRLSDMGPDGDASYDAAYPSLSFNAISNEYFVIWTGRDDVFPSLNGQPQLYGQQLSGPATVRFVNATQSVLENAGSATIDVQRIGDTSNTIMVDYSTANGTAINPTDYTSASGTLVFSAGESSKTFTVNVTDTSEAGGDRTVNISLSNAQAVAGDAELDSLLASTVLTISDADTKSSKGGGAFDLLTLLLFGVVALVRKRLLV